MHKITLAKDIARRVRYVEDIVDAERSMLAASTLARQSDGNLNSADSFDHNWRAAEVVVFTMRNEGSVSQEPAAVFSSRDI